MLLSFIGESNPIPQIGSLKVKSQTSISFYKRLYPLARTIENFGHTFLIEETIFLFVAFKGSKSTKPLVFKSFDNLNTLTTYYYSFVDKVLNAADSKRGRCIRAAKKNDREIQPGAIFYTSWSGDPTNIEFFQIIAVKGRTATIQRIKSNITNQAGDHGWIRGVKDSFLDAPIRLRIGIHGMRIDAIRYLNFWDKKALYWFV